MLLQTRVVISCSLEQGQIPVRCYDGELSQYRAGTLCMGVDSLLRFSSRIATPVRASQFAGIG